MTDTVLDSSTLKRRAKHGVLLLGARTGLQQLISLGGMVCLARALGPKEFGAFWIVQSVLAFFNLFGDAGFGAALIQKSRAATHEELSSVFWFQTGLAAAVVGVVFLAAPWVVQLWPTLPATGVWMLRALSVNLLLTSARTIPAILLERELRFGKLSVIDLVLTASYNGCAVALALLGYGTFALIAGVLAQGVAGLAAAYAFRPFRPALYVSRELLRPILRFGVTFQLKTIVAFANDAVMPLYAGTSLGTYAFGLVSWSRSTAYFPVQLVTILARVNFPLLSRLQHDPPAFASALGRTVGSCAAVSMLCTTLICGLGPMLVQVIYGEHWLAALPTLYVFAGAIAIGFFVPILGPALDALGRPEIMMRLAVGWTTLNWIGVVLAVQLRPSALSFTIGYCVHILVGNLATIWVVQRLLPTVRVWPQLRAAMLASLPSVALARFCLLPWVQGPVSLGFAILTLVLSFGLLLCALDRDVRQQLAGLWKTRRFSWR